MAARAVVPAEVRVAAEAWAEARAEARAEAPGEVQAEASVAAGVAWAEARAAEARVAAEAGGWRRGGGRQAGGGGGGAGGGGGGAGGGGGCVVLSNFPFTSTAGASSATSNELSATEIGTPQALELQMWFSFGASAPGVGVLDGGETYQSCAYCTFVSQGCASYPLTGSPKDCTGPNYLGQTGTVNVSSASDPLNASGYVHATFQSLELVEWDFTADAPVTGGSCILIPNDGFDVTW